MESKYKRCESIFLFKFLLLKYSITKDFFENTEARLATLTLVIFLVIKYITFTKTLESIYMFGTMNYVRAIINLTSKNIRLPKIFLSIYCEDAGC